MASDNWPTYVILAIYVLLTVIVTVAARKKNNDPDDLNTEVTKHFLGSKNFGPLLLTFTTFASVFSGYTVVGVPNEAGTRGFFAIRWMGLIIAVGVAMLWLYPRLRRLSMVNNYESPGDFIQDRFGSRALSIMVAMLMCIPQILYIGINIYSLGTTLESLTDGELDFYWIVVVCTIMILILEALGGMRSVAYTDAVEAIVMVAIFVTVPSMIGVYYGGFGGQINNSEDLTIPCDNSYDDGTNGCLNYVAYGLVEEDTVNSTDTTVGGIGFTTSDMGLLSELSEYYLRSPSSVTILNYVLFCVGGLSFSLNPHICQRALTAKADAHVRIIIVAIFIATFITMTPGILTGITALSNHWDDAAFPAMLDNFKERGGFASFVSYVALLAGIAGIMSTADSALIGVSNTLSVDIFKNHVFTDLKPEESRKIVYVGKAVSLVTMSLCLGFACWLYNTDEDYGSVYTIQQGLLWQSVPAYIFGLYTNLSANAVLSGTSLGVVTCVILISVLFADDGAHDPLPLVDKSWSTFVGVAVNVFTSVIAHFFIFSSEKGPDDNSLSLDDIKKIMKGITEPMTRFGGALVYLSMTFCVIAAFHWIGEIDPELIDEYGRDYAEEVMYNGKVRNVIGGLPDYIFATMMWYLLAIAVGVAAALQWDVTAADDACPGTPNSRKETKKHVGSDSVHQTVHSGSVNGLADAVTNGTEMVSAGNGEVNKGTEV